MSEALAKLQTALDLHGAGNVAGAAVVYREAIALDPYLADAWAFAGVASAQQGQPMPAIELISVAVALAPDRAAHYANLGAACVAAGKRAGATRMLQHALRIDPLHVDARTNLGRAAAAGGRLPEALGHLQLALTARPDQGDAALELADVMRKLRQTARAIGWAARSRSLLPQAWEPLLAEGQAKAEAGRLDEALALLEEANRRSPQNPTILWAAGLVLLGKGQLTAGWRLYETRFAANPHMPYPFAAERQWRGDPISGRRLLVWWEQGIGDELVFASCLPDLESSGAQVSIACDGRLVPLYRRSFPWAEIVGLKGAADLARSFPPESIDLHVPSGSLPGLLRPDMASFIPQAYLRAEPARVGDWHDWLAGRGGGRKVGLLWRGLLTSRERDVQYTRAEDWQQILKIPGLDFICLQYGASAGELASLPAETAARLHMPPGLDLRDDFDSLAALVSALDVVIGPTTAATALAGALGRPTWVFQRGLDWMRLGSDSASPWMPQFRQIEAAAEEGWASVIGRIGERLREFADTGLDV